jgi:hypothetical protein
MEVSVRRKGYPNWLELLLLWCRLHKFIAEFFFLSVWRAPSGQKIKCQIVSQRVRDALPFLRLTTHRAVNPVRES